MQDGSACVFQAKRRRVIFAEEKANKEKNPTGLPLVSADLRTFPAGVQLWQTLQTQAQFQLQLPPGKMCSADYAGLLRAFQVFISDELTARGFCHIQVRARPSLQWGLGLCVREPQFSGEPTVQPSLISPVGTLRPRMRRGFSQS